MAEVTRNAEQSRFEVWVDGVRAGELDYVVDGDTWVLPHTGVDKAYEGQGLASQLVRTALDTARAEGITVKPVCPYVVTWLQRHPDYQDLVA